MTNEEIFRDIKDIEQLILGDEKYYELVDRYTMAESKRDESREVYNWDER